MIVKADFLPRLQNSTGFADWEDANKLSRIGYRNKALTKYQASYDRLKVYSAFLEDYSGSLIYIGKYDKAINLLSQAIKQRSSSTLYLKLGHCFWQTGKIEKAEQAYIMAIQMVPNRFQSRYALFKFYKDTEQKEKAYKCAEELLALPVKIPSVQVDHIKATVKNKKENLIAPLD
jgi:tetratricopeptide (TPR) repeat protein